MFRRWTKVLRVWNIRVSNDKFHFWVNYAFKALLLATSLQVLLITIFVKIYTDYQNQIGPLQLIKKDGTTKVLNQFVLQAVLPHQTVPPHASSTGAQEILIYLFNASPSWEPVLFSIIFLSLHFELHAPSLVHKITL